MKHILITGASSGLGEALARHYASDNVLLSLCGRDKTRLDTIGKQCKKLGATTHTKIIDVTDKTAMDTWITARDKKYPIDIIIANAGISGTDNSLTSAEKIFDINMGGVVNTIHPIIPRMVERRTGQIALISSLAGYKGLSSAPAYSASKVFVKGYGEALRGKLSLDDIKVNVICPGFVRSRITDQNDFPMPGFMEADKAAKIIVNRLSKNKAIIAFPWFMRFGAWFLSILPAFIAEWITDLLPQKY
jgi:short-subunit dehydrogenase